MGGMGGGMGGMMSRPLVMMPLQGLSAVANMIMNLGGLEREIEQSCRFSFIVSASSNGDSISEARSCEEAHQEVQAHAA
jgi:hypothetical protein